MPTYCHSCPYNSRFCKGVYIENPTCPHGYSPLRRDDTDRGFTASYDDSSTKKARVLEPGILIKIGKAAASKDDYETAKECYEKALEIEPNNSQASFLIRRINYILGNNIVPSIDDVVELEKTTEPVQKRVGMLPLQEEKRISIKTKSQFEIDPNIINKDQNKVYQIENDDDESELEEVSKHVAREIKKSSKKEKRNMGLAAGIIVILLMIFLLWYFGYLRIGI